MKRSQLEEMIEEELHKYFAEMASLDEKSVPEPYNRKSPPRRKMNTSQIQRRKTIGDKMKNNTKTVAKFKKKYGADWESYLWASASSIALKGGEQK
jgi:hypothetical protein